MSSWCYFEVIGMPCISESEINVLNPKIGNVYRYGLLFQENYFKTEFIIYVI